jgi:hypothetical protein
VGGLAPAQHPLPAGACLPGDRARSGPGRDAGSEPKGGFAASSSLIPRSVPEVRRRLHTLQADAREGVFRLGWSRWRRAHQAVAQRSHRARRTLAQAVVPLAVVAPPTTPGALTDAAWERVRDRLPPQRPSVGRPKHDHRTVLSGILWVLRTPAPWREMPAG